MELRSPGGSPSGWGRRSRGRAASQLPPLSGGHVIKWILCLSEKLQTGFGSCFRTKPWRLFAGGAARWQQAHRKRRGRGRAAQGSPGPPVCLPELTGETLAKGRMRFAETWAEPHKAQCEGCVRSRVM